MGHLAFLITMLALLMVPVLGTASAADLHARPYGIDEIIALAMERNPAVAGAAATVKEARGQQVIAGAYPNPSITGAVGPGKTREQLGEISFLERDFAVNQPLEWPGMRQARQRAAEAGLAGAAAALEEAQLIVLADVKVAFYQLLLAQRDLELTTQTLALARDLYRSIQARVDAGQARPFDAIKANVEVQKVSKDLSRAENTLLAARVRLDRLTTGGLGPDFVVQGDFESSRRALNRQELITSALEQHPTLRRLGKLSEKAEHSIAQERQSVIPYVTVSGLFRQEAAETSYLGQLSVPLPLWYRRDGHITAALGAKERTEADRVRAQNELVTAITEHVQEARTASQQLDVFEKGLLKQAEEALRIARISFQQGAASLLDLIDAQRVYQQMLLEYAQARAAYSIAVARLERWVGALP